MRERITWIEPQDEPGTAKQFRRILRELESAYVVTKYDSVSAALKNGTAERFVVAVSRPGLLSLSEVTSLRNSGVASTNDSQSVLLLGDWCCGLKRTLPSDAGARLCYAHEFQDGHAAAWLFGSQASVDKLTVRDSFRSIAVYARSYSYRSALSESISRFDSSVVELEFGDAVGTSGIDAVLWEVAPQLSERRQELAELRLRHPQAQLIALMTFPRFDEIAKLSEIGVRVLAQPFDEESLANAILVSDKDDEISLKMSA